MQIKLVQIDVVDLCMRVLKGPHGVKKLGRADLSMFWSENDELVNCLLESFTLVIVRV